MFWEEDKQCYRHYLYKSNFSDPLNKHVMIGILSFVAGNYWMSFIRSNASHLGVLEYKHEADTDRNNPPKQYVESIVTLMHGDI